MLNFRNFKIKEINSSSLIGGQDPGYETETSGCTWQLKWANGSDESGGDTERDGDWEDACM